MQLNPVKPEILLDMPLPKLKGREQEIYALIMQQWPTSAIEIAEHFGEELDSRESRRKASTKYAYYLQKLIDKRLLLSKRVGNALVVWPIRAEKLRAIHAILESKEAP